MCANILFMMLHNAHVQQANTKAPFINTSLPLSLSFRGRRPTEINSCPLFHSLQGPEPYGNKLLPSLSLSPSRCRRPTEINCCPLSLSLSRGRRFRGINCCPHTLSLSLWRQSGALPSCSCSVSHVNTLGVTQYTLSSFAFKIVTQPKRGWTAIFVQYSLAFNLVT